MRALADLTAIRDSATFSRQLDALRDQEFASAEARLAFQMSEVRRLLTHCGAHVPYYRRLFDRHGIDPQSIRTPDDFRRVPLLDKDTIKAHHADFIADTVDTRTLDHLTTGGSTGAPLKVMMDVEYKARRLATTYYYMGLAGLNPEEFRSVRLHGNTLDAALVGASTFWTLETPAKLVMSSYHITAVTAPRYVEQINQHRPDYIHAFPSSLALLAEYAEKLPLTVTARPRAVFCDSEVLYPWQRRLIERVFAAKVYDVYGHTEGAVLGVSCPASEKLHLVPQVGYAEILDDRDRPIAAPAQAGWIVVTGFLNYAFPIVRYRTFDQGIVSREGCPCGRQALLLDRIEGRLQDFVVDRAGGLVPLAPALFDYNFDWSGVDRFQVYQETPGRLTFRVVPEAAAAQTFDALGRRIASGFERILNGGFEIETVRLEAIEPTARGKRRYLDQKIDLAAFAPRRGGA
ncbi:MAG: AMP-binding protein [Acidobacteriia bacterium]|nr:AMP-binding protein [Terriglobia bacterium]